MDHNIKRIFIAIRFFPDPLFFTLLMDIKRKLENEKIRWVKNENLHITLRYLGDVENEKIPGISGILSDISLDTEDFQLIYKNLGVFRSLSYPKVLWSGVEKNEKLEKLKIRIDKALNGYGFDLNPEGFTPHLTLGRMKFLKDKQGLADIIKTYRNKVFLRQNVESVVLLESKLSNKGPEYITISEHFFSGSEAGAKRPGP